MADPAALQHQSYSPFPQLGTRFVDENGVIDRGWYRFLIDLWRKAGGSLSQASNAAFVAQTPTNAGAPLSINSSSTGETIGTLALQNSPPGPVIPQVLGVSPFLFQAAEDGNLIVFSGKLELSRDGITWFTAGLQGGALPMKMSDHARVTWYEAGTANKPTVTFFANY